MWLVTGFGLRPQLPSCVHRRIPPSRGSTPHEGDPLEQHREFVHIDLHTSSIRPHVAQRGKRASLQPLVHDREAAARPHEQLHLVAPAIQEHQDVTAQRVFPQNLPSLRCSGRRTTFLAAWFPIRAASEWYFNEHTAQLRSLREQRRTFPTEGAQLRFSLECQMERGLMPVGSEPRVAHGADDILVLPLRMPARVVERMDEARRRLGLASRAELFRRARHRYLSSPGSASRRRSRACARGRSSSGRACAARPDLGRQGRPRARRANAAPNPRWPTRLPWSLRKSAFVERPSARRCTRYHSRPSRAVYCRAGRAERPDGLDEPTRTSSSAPPVPSVHLHRVCHAHTGLLAHRGKDSATRSRSSPVQPPNHRGMVRRWLSPGHLAARRDPFLVGWLDRSRNSRLVLGDQSPSMTKTVHRSP